MIKNSKIIHLSEIGKISSSWAGRKTVLVGGCFDLFHYGHFVFLKKAREAGEYLIVILESGKFIREIKNKNPVHTQKQRAEILSGMQFVDLVIMLPYMRTGEEYVKLVKNIKPSVIAVTENDPLLKIKGQQAKMIGGKLEIVTSVVAGLSSNKILNELI